MTTMNAKAWKNATLGASVALVWAMSGCSGATKDTQPNAESVGSTSQAVTNLLLNPTMDVDVSNWDPNSVTSVTGGQSSKCAQIAPGGWMDQTVSATQGTYTLSGYLKSSGTMNGTMTFSAGCQDVNWTWIASASPCATAFSGVPSSTWTQYTATCTCPAGTEHIEIDLNNSGSTGNVLVDTLSFGLVTDTIAPSVPTGLTAPSATSSSVNLSWTASTDNIGVTGYKIYRCTGASCTPTTANLVGTSATTSSVNAGLAASTTYGYRISAYDAAGNNSAISTTTVYKTTTAGAPAPAAAVGYNTRTFGPNLTIGTNWFKSNVYGSDPNGQNVTQSGNGVILAGGSNTYNDHLGTARMTGATTWQGTAFGGGAYMEATLSFSGTLVGWTQPQVGWPSWWANAMEAYDGSPMQWPGQVTGYKNSVEPDFMEFMQAGNSTVYSSGLHNWYGTNGSDVATNWANTSFPAGLNGSQSHKYGALWVPATSTTQGYMKYYLDGVLQRTQVWNKYSTATPPPPVIGTSAFSILDNLHLRLILGTHPNNPMTVTSVEVWQASAANNLVHP